MLQISAGQKAVAKLVMARDDLDSGYCEHEHEHEHAFIREPPVLGRVRPGHVGVEGSSARRAINETLLIAHRR